MWSRFWTDIAQNLGGSPAAPDKTGLEIMRPALGVGQSGLPGVVLVGAVAVGEQHRTLGRSEAEGLDHVLIHNSLDFAA